MKPIAQRWNRTDKPGFEPIPGYAEPCRDPSHQPPTMLYIPPGQQYRHVCPTCGAVVILRGSSATL